MRAKPAEMILAMAGRQPREEPSSATAHLIAQAKAGDTRAFEMLMMRYERHIYRLALRLLGHQEDAQDATQEVFLRLYKHLSRLDENRELVPWLYRVTVNVCHDLVRRRQRNTMVSLDDVDMDALTESMKTEWRAELAQQRRILAEGLKTLSQNERAAVVLRDIEGLSTEDVARILGSSTSTVRSHLSRARVKLKRFVDRVREGRS